MGIVFNCDSCPIWKAFSNASFSVKSDINSCFFQRILFQTQAVLSNSSMFCFFDTDVLLCCHKSDYKPSVVVPEELCLLLNFYELF